MSQPEALRDEFESFRDRTDARLRAVERDLPEVRTLAEANDSELAGAKGNTRLIQALRQTQIEHGQMLAEHGRMLEEHGQRLSDQGHTLTLLAASYVGLEEDVAQLKTDVSTLKTDVSTLKTDVSTLKGSVAGILQILDERLPPKP